MLILNSIYQLILADLRERTRQISFFVVLGITVYLGYLMVPAPDSEYNAFMFCGQRGLYNSAWVGTIFGIIASTLLSLAGFYLIKNSIARDYSTRVGLIIASTPLSKVIFIIGKWISNLILFTIILSILTIIAFIMQLLRAEDKYLNIIELIAPIWLIGMPTLAIVSSISILFECIPFLRSGLGNAIYFFIWVTIIILFVGNIFQSVVDLEPHNDFFGLSRTIVDIREQIISKGFSLKDGETDLFVPVTGNDIRIFRWTGIKWTLDIIVERLMWFCLSVLLVLSAVIPFDRFDPKKNIYNIKRKRTKTNQYLVEYLIKRFLLLKNKISYNHKLLPSLSSFVFNNTLIKINQQNLFLIIFFETKLLLRRQKWWWFTVAIVFNIACLIVPYDICTRNIFPLLWLWPLTVWSALGNQETKFNTGKIVFSISNLHCYQLPALWITGLLVAIIAGWGPGLRFIIEGSWNNVFAWINGALFISSLALFLGVWSKKSGVFEIIYLIIWFIGPLIGLPFRNYYGLANGLLFLNCHVIYVLISIMLSILALVLRKTQ
ncbi:MAG: hypothetical protein V1773_11065 [bacterium]